MYERGVHARSDRRTQVVVDAVADVQDLVVCERHDCSDTAEELWVRLARAPVVRRADQIDIVPEQLTEDLPGPDRLVARDADP